MGSEMRTNICQIHDASINYDSPGFQAMEDWVVQTLLPGLQNLPIRHISIDTRSYRLG